MPGEPCQRVEPVAALGDNVDLIEKTRNAEAAAGTP